MYDKKGVSRRDLLKRAGMAGAAFTIPMAPLLPAAPVIDAPEQAPAAPPRREPIENLTAAEADMLEAICARIIPSDASGPGAREARAAHYIDRALGGALKDSREAYRAGFAAFDAYCRSSRRAPFTELSERDQDSVLIDVETGAATGFPASSAQFFAMVRTHTLQGTFGDPYYGGNANFVGWDLIAFPGLRLNVSIEDQRLGAKLTPTHRSAYDHDMFTKAVAAIREPGAGKQEPAAGNGEPGREHDAPSVASAALGTGMAHGH
jgi:gluconate 2-dehydrogenase gamma chain